MLYYDFVDWHQLLLNNIKTAQKFSDSLINNPINPFSYLPQTKFLNKYWQVLINTNINYEKPEFIFNDPKIITEKFLQSNFAVVKKIYIPTSKAKNKYLIISPISGNYATVFINFIEELLSRKPNSEIYITEWHNARDVSIDHGKFQVKTNVQEILFFLKEINPAHVITFSQSGNPTLIALIQLAKQKRTIPQTCCFIGVPFDTRVNSLISSLNLNENDIKKTLSNMFIKVPSKYQGCNRLVLPGLYQYLGFWNLNRERNINMQVRLFTQSVYNDWQLIDKASKYSSHLHSVMDIYAEHVLDNLKHFFIEQNLINNQFSIGNLKINLKDLSQIKILSIEGIKDVLCPAGQTSAILPILTGIPNSHKKNLKIDCGHFGLIVGSKFQNKILPKIIEFTQL